MRYFVSIAEQCVEVEVERSADGTFHVHGPDGARLQVTPLAHVSGLITLHVGGQLVEVQVAEGEVRLAEQRYATRAESALERAQQRATVATDAGPRHLVASMPGRIVRILCEAGQTVTAGTPLVVIEAMKMQNELCAKTDSVVRAVRVAVGQTVERGGTLVELD